MGFDAEWLAARAPFDEGALDQKAMSAMQDWGRQLPAGYVPVVVDLGSGTGVALERVRRWLAPRPMVGYAVDRDADLLARIAPPNDGSRVVAIVGDVLLPLDGLGGPPDGAVDLVVGHALADLLPLDRLATRVSALLRPGGLAYLALVYDGLTDFAPADDLDVAIIAAFHRHMDRPARDVPGYGGSTAGRRLGAALLSAGLDVRVDAPAVWSVRAGDGRDAITVMAGLLGFIVRAVRELGAVPPEDLERWAVARQAALAQRTLSARVGHRDLLAQKPESDEGGPPR